LRYLDKPMSCFRENLTDSKFFFSLFSASYQIVFLNSALKKQTSLHELEGFTYSFRVPSFLLTPDIYCFIFFDQKRKITWF